MIKGQFSSPLLRFDGGAQPQHGPTAGAYVLYDEQGKRLAEGGRFLECGTSNVGEYTGLIAGLKKAHALGLTSLHIEGDSLLVISQITGKWKVKDEKMKCLHAKAMDYLERFTNVHAKHIPRENNGYADSLSDYTLERRKHWSKVRK